MNVDSLHLAITTYFSGESREMLVILCGCALAVALAGAPYVVAKDGFSTGFASLVLVAVLPGWTAVSLLQRDAAYQAALMASVSGPQVQQAWHQEVAHRVSYFLG